MFILLVFTCVIAGWLYLKWSTSKYRHLSSPGPCLPIIGHSYKLFSKAVLADPATGNVRVRPVFVLTEAFIRGLRLANARKPELPETTAPCQDVNYSKIAIKFSKSLTKVRTAEGASEQASISSE